MILALKKCSLNLFITIVTIDWFSFKTDITVNFVQLKKITNSFFQPGEEDEVLRGHGVGHLQLSRDQGRWEEKNQWNDKKRWAGRKCFISIPFLHRILNCQFGASSFFKGWSGPRASWIWKSKFGSTIWGDLVQCTYKRTERDQASVSIVICLNARWTMKRQLFWRDVWLHGMALVLMVASHWPNDSFVQNHHSGLILMLVDVT